MRCALGICVVYSVAAFVGLRFFDVTIFGLFLDTRTEMEIGKAMNALMNDDTVELIMLPGMLRRYSMGAIGPLTKNTLHEIHADILFMGASAISSDGVWSSNLVEADTKRSMIKAADAVCLLADSKKLMMKGLGKIAPWKDIDYFVSDSIPDDFRSKLEEAGVKVIIAPEA